MRTARYTTTALATALLVAVGGTAMAADLAPGSTGPYYGDNPDHSYMSHSTAGTISAYESCGSIPLQAAFGLGARTEWSQPDAPAYQNPRAGGTAVVTAVDASGTSTEVYRWTTPAAGVVTRSDADVLPFQPTAPALRSSLGAGGNYGPSTWSMTATVALPEGSEAATLTLTSPDGSAVSATAEVTELSEACEVPLPPVPEPEVPEPTEPAPEPVEETPLPEPVPVDVVPAPEQVPDAVEEPAALPEVPAVAPVVPVAAEPVQAPRVPRVTIHTDLPPEGRSYVTPAAAGAILAALAAATVLVRRRRHGA
ncbi:hypothetical protein [Sanguibacter sp. Leaf3]|uniref:hypothetical protein n=1 Tax=Sanguibacter sp. Leaf3 TaxID=1736209 RepID=UPI0006FF074A|nr:hypothetical protein [Sanguibacter sp. Leaf3]KQT98388.1 hypothetical protein ASG53_12060 [Sanguibacter sp. Leaf3]